MLRKILHPKKEKVKGESRKLHNDEQGMLHVWGKDAVCAYWVLEMG